MEVCMYVLWMIWTNRNYCLHNGICKLPQRLELEARYRDKVFKSVSTDGALAVLAGAVSGTTVRGGSNGEVWSPPSPGKIKVNVDASFDKLSTEAGAGVVAQEENGLFVFLLSTRFDHVDSPLLAETKAILWGMRLGCG
ncbi:hypothetical protein REPUB_Repub16aG0107000 [Reevesia pubescens]